MRHGILHQRHIDHIILFTEWCDSVCLRATEGKDDSYIFIQDHLPGTLKRQATESLGIESKELKHVDVITNFQTAFSIDVIHHNLKASDSW